MLRPSLMHYHVSKTGDGPIVLQESVEQLRKLAADVSRTIGTSLVQVLNSHRHEPRRVL